jgi:hypothetical protein
VLNFRFIPFHADYFALAGFYDLPRLFGAYDWAITRKIANPAMMAASKEGDAISVPNNNVSFGHGMSGSEDTAGVATNNKRLGSAYPSIPVNVGR